MSGLAHHLFSSHAKHVRAKRRNAGRTKVVGVRNVKIPVVLFLFPRIPEPQDENEVS